MNASSFDHILRKVVVVPVGALLIGAALFAWQIKIANWMVSQIELNDYRLRQTLLIEKLVIDEEAGLRGYELTHDPQLLSSYYKAKEALPGAFATRRSMAAGARVQTLENIQHSQESWEQGFAAPLIATIEGGGHTDDVALNLEGKRMMDQIRDQIEGLNVLTYQKRTEAIDQWRRQARAMIGTVIAFAIFGGLILGLYVRRLIEKISTAFRQSHEVLRIRAEQTFRSEERLRATLQSIGEGVITCDSSGLVQTMNDAAQSLTGWIEEEARNQELDVVLPVVDESSQQPVQSAAREILGSNSRFTLQHQSLLRRRDGAELYIEESGSPMRDKDGALAGVVIVVRDVTLQRKSQLALMANEKLAVAGRLAASIAHEIHNPLDSVSNLLYLMDGVASEGERDHFVRLAKQEIDRVTQISRAMLSLYRESRSPVMVDLGETLASILLLMESKFRMLGVAVFSELPPSLVVEGFPAEIRQVFTNLLTNAAEAAGVGGHVTVRGSALESAPVQSISTGPGALVTVADDGPGIAEDTVPKLFQPFFTTKGERGTGLGLWISRGIVMKHGGAIWISSSVGAENHGTTVSVFLAEHPTMTVSAN